MNDTKLSPKRERFCREYVIDHAPGAAAIRAGYSEKTASAQASRLLTDVNVKNFIEVLEREIAARLGITADMVLKEYAAIAFADAFEHINQSTGEVKPEANGKLFKSISVKATKSGMHKSYKLHSKLPALEILAQYTGLIKKSLEITLPEEVVKQAQELLDGIAEAEEKLKDL